VLAVCLITGVSSVLKIGAFNPKNKDRDAIDVMKDEFLYFADKLGISSKEPPSD